MPWRKWFVRSLVFSIIGASAAVAVVYQRWTDPAMVREMVLAKLQEMYPGAVITVDSARLRILGGIQVNELRMSRRDDPDRAEFFHVPSAIIYHDKEKISHGQLTLRKIELNHPRLRAVKKRDGTWNLQGIIKERAPDQTAPTLVLHHGTILIEDQRSALPTTTVEINDLTLSFINDPLEIITVVGSANSSVLGTVQLKGTIHRDTREIDVKVKTAGTVIGPAVMQHVMCACPSMADLFVEARVDVDAELCYRPGQPEPLDYNVSLNVATGKLRHPKLPLPLEEIKAQIECSNGSIKIDNFQARSRQTLLKGWATAQLPCPDSNFETELELQHLHVDADLAARVSDKIHLLQQLFQARGPATVKIACARRDGQWANLSSGAEAHVTLQPEGAEACFKHFSYPLHKVEGVIDWAPVSGLTRVDVVAYAAQAVPGQPAAPPMLRPVAIVGSWLGQGDQVSSSFDISADDVLIEPGLVAALPEKIRKLTHSFHPAGWINIRGHLHRQPGSSDFRHEYHVAMRDGSVCWDEFPFRLDRVSGYLDIFPGKWIFHGGHGCHGEGEVQIEGKSVSAPLPQSLAENGAARADDGLELTFVGRQLALDDPALHKALAPMPQMAKAWASFRPRGKLNFGARVDLPPGRHEDVDVVVNINGAGIDPQFFPYLLSGISGQFRYRKNCLEGTNIEARHNDTRLQMQHAKVDMLPGGGHYTEFNKLLISGLRADRELLNALPRSLRSFTEALQLSKPVDISTRLVIRQDSEPGSLPDIGWDGKMLVKDTQFSAGVTLSNVHGEIGCRGHHDGHSLRGIKGTLLFDQAAVFSQKFRKGSVHFEVKPDFPDTVLMDLNAPIFGGNITGRASVELTSRLRYEVDLSASHIDLQQFGAHNLGQRSQLEGLMEGRLYLTGFGTGAETLDGNGRIDVNHGKLYNLPLLLDLLKFLGLRWPDRTAFEDLHADFSIRGSRARVSKLELIGNLVSLIGKGEFNLDGTDLNLDFRPTWGQIDRNPLVGPISGLISKNILIIEMRGKVDSKPDSLKFNKRFVPLLSDPFRELRQPKAAE